MLQLVLWDVDHTLIENSGVSKEIYAEAFRRASDMVPKIPAVTEGRTDRAIMRDMFWAHGLPVPEWAEMHRHLAAAGADKMKTLSQRGYVLPGVAEVLLRLAARGDVIQTIVTGNIEENAHVKLAAFGIDGYLDFNIGGYGSDSFERADLVRIAQGRSSAAVRLTTFDATNTVVVGDTLRDIQAAHAAGARAVAVATGIDSELALKQAGADAVLPSLADTDAALSAIRGLPFQQ